MHRCKCPGVDAPLTFWTGPASEFRIVCLDNLTAIYDRASGQTHVVVEPVPQILSALSEGDAGVSELLDRLGRTDTLESRTLLLQRLQELLEIGLIASR